MTTIEIARNLAELGQEKDACAAYTLSLQNEEAESAEKMEAACYLLRFGEDYKIPYTLFLNLYSENCFQSEILNILTQAFYEPNEAELQKQYKMNCKLLRKYPYLFRKDFPSFERLPIRFFPYDDKGGYLPFFASEKRFAPFVNIKDPVITRNFFRDLQSPILADDVYSQYELEYLVDNVRKSEDIARENHIYLHYTDWTIFCSWLQVLDFRRLLRENKIVFLMEEEISQYPIDFKARFGIDYSQYPLRRVGIREAQRLIWHAQLSSSNGGDFFNEVFDFHPNLCFAFSIMYTHITKTVETDYEFLKRCGSLNEALKGFDFWKDPWLVENLYRIRNRTKKDVLVAIYMNLAHNAGNLDMASRIVPAIFFQPHFSNVEATLEVGKNGETVFDTNVSERIESSPLFTEFKYIKTFTPMRRFTTAYGSTMRFMEKEVDNVIRKEGEDANTVFGDLITDRVLNRTYMRDPENRLYRDSVVVRFEDGKLNPRATFTKLAEFLDLPYTETMTYCSANGVRDVQTDDGNAVGFDPITVYKTYDDYCCQSERCFLEYFMRDAYQYYGYDFHFYDGTPVNEELIRYWLQHFDILDYKIQESWKFKFSNLKIEQAKNEKQCAQIREKLLEEFMKRHHKNRLYVAMTLQRGLRFVNKRGQPLEMTPMLQPDPALLVQPLYH